MNKVEGGMGKYTSTQRFKIKFLFVGLKTLTEMVISYVCLIP